MEAIAQDYADQNVRFYYIYKSLAHPGWNNYTAPFSLEERLMHVAEAQRTLGTKIPWLCDGMEDSFAQTMGGAPHSEIIFDPEGKIVSRHGWHKPQRLREELAALVGPIEDPTDPASLNLPTPLPVASAATDVMPPIERPAVMRPLALKPVSSGGHPYYAKLRAEADPRLLMAGRGKLYLRFSLDPLYGVHWNNLVTPIQVELDGPETISFEPDSFEGPNLEQTADADPREFLCTVKTWDVDDIVTVRVLYFACHDEEGWCKRVEQTYELELQSSRGAGYTFSDEQEKRIRKSLDLLESGPPEPRITATEDQLKTLAGLWQMETSMPGDTKEWKLNLELNDGSLSGWSTYDRARPDIDVISFDGQEFRFLQFDAGLAPEEIVLQLNDGRLSGTHLSAFGDFRVRGKPLDE